MTQEKHNGNVSSDMPPSIGKRFCLMACAATALSTGSSGSINGTVVDPTGALVPNATVEIRNPVSQFDRSTTSDSSGKFEFTNIPFNPSVGAMLFADRVGRATGDRRDHGNPGFSVGSLFLGARLIFRQGRPSCARSEQCWSRCFSFTCYFFTGATLVLWLELFRSKNRKRRLLDSAAQYVFLIDPLRLKWPVRH